MNWRGRGKNAGFCDLPHNVYYCVACSYLKISCRETHVYTGCPLNVNKNETTYVNSEVVVKVNGAI